MWVCTSWFRVLWVAVDNHWIYRSSGLRDNCSMCAYTVCIVHDKSIDKMKDRIYIQTQFVDKYWSLFRLNWFVIAITDNFCQSSLSEYSINGSIFVRIKTRIVKVIRTLDIRAHQNFTFSVERSTEWSHLPFVRGSKEEVQKSNMEMIPVLRFVSFQFSHIAIGKHLISIQRFCFIHDF